MIQCFIWFSQRWATLNTWLLFNCNMSTTPSSHPDQEKSQAFMLDLGLGSEVDWLVRMVKSFLESLVLLMFVWKHDIWFSCIFLAMCMQKIKFSFHTGYVENPLFSVSLQFYWWKKSKCKVYLYNLYWFSIQVETYFKNI